MDLSLVFKSGDVVLIGVFVLMLLMSVVTWSVIVIRCIKYRKAKKCTGKRVDAECVYAG